MKSRLVTVAALAAAMLACGCRHGGAGEGSVSQSADTTRQDVGVRFDADSAFSYVESQVALGPRVPGTEASRQCVAFITGELERHGAQMVRVQQATVTAYNGDKLPINNVMAAYRPELKDRVMLVAHFDSRPWGDSDDREENRMAPIPGANDGASGVGVMLEIARQLGQTEAPVGVDLLFVDAEDYGQSSGFSNHDESWCLGTQYWTRNMPYATDSLPRYAVLLDMVGGMDAKFHREYFSDKAASQVVDRVWAEAARSGYGDRFVNVAGGAVIDDHVFLNRAGIPAIDIIESKNDVTKSFNPTWHTMADDMDHIDRSSLKAAGQTVLNVIYSEK